MKKLLVATAVAMTLSATAHAADSTAMLKLEGTLTNEPCVGSISGGGTVDFGTKRIAELSATDTNQLGSLDTSFTITCSAPTKMGWYINDNRADSRASLTVQGGFIDGETGWRSESTFGVGKTAGGTKIGSYTVSVDTANSVADGNIKEILSTNTDTAPNYDWSLFNVNSLDIINSNGGAAYTTGSNDTPEAFTTATFPLRISLAVDSTDILAITEDTPIDGDATITMFYL